MRITILAILLLSQPVLASGDKVHKSCFIKPCEIKGDFDGDGKLDSAALVVNRKQDRKGIEIKFANKKTAVLGAGNDFGNGGDNFDWMDSWSLHKGKIEQGAVEFERPPTPKGDSLLLEKSGSASGLAYWNGSKFVWYQQGD